MSFLRFLTCLLLLAVVLDGTLTVTNAQTVATILSTTPAAATAQWPAAVGRAGWIAGAIGGTGVAQFDDPLYAFQSPDFGATNAQLAGSGDGIVWPRTSQCQPPFSFAAWLHFGTLGTQQPRLIGTDLGALLGTNNPYMGPSSNHDEVFFGFTSPTSFGIQFYNGVDVLQSCVTTYTPVLQQWFLIGATFDAAGVARVYLNGVEVATCSGLTNPRTDLFTANGRTKWYWNAHRNGGVAAVHWFQRLVSSADMLILATNPHPAIATAAPMINSIVRFMDTCSSKTLRVTLPFDMVAVYGSGFASVTLTISSTDASVTISPTTLTFTAANSYSDTFTINTGPRVSFFQVNFALDSNALTKLSNPAALSINLLSADVINTQAMFDTGYTFTPSGLSNSGSVPSYQPGLGGSGVASLTTTGKVLQFTDPTHVGISGTFNPAQFKTVTTGATLAFWWQPNSANSGHIMSQIFTTLTSDRFEVSTAATGISLNAYCRNGQSSTTINIPALSLGVWHHLVVSISNGGLASVYVDNVLVGIRNMFPSAPGSRSTWSARGWNNGFMARTTFWPFPLNQEQVSTIFSEPPLALRLRAVSAVSFTGYDVSSSVVQTGLSMTPAFVSGAYTPFTLTAPLLATQISVQLTSSGSGHLTSINSNCGSYTSFTPSSMSSKVSLVAGVNYVHVTSTFDGPYLFIVNYAADVSALALECAGVGSTLSPNFLGGAFTYTATVPNSCANVNVRATFGAVNSVSVLLNGVSQQPNLPSTSLSSPIPVIVGSSNNVQISSTRDGMYTIVVTRLAGAAVSSSSTGASSSTGTAVVMSSSTAATQSSSSTGVSTVASSSSVGSSTATAISSSSVSSTAVVVTVSSSTSQTATSQTSQTASSSASQPMSSSSTSVAISSTAGNAAASSSSAVPPASSSGAAADSSTGVAQTMSSTMSQAMSSAGGAASQSTGGTAAGSPCGSPLNPVQPPIASFVHPPISITVGDTLQLESLIEFTDWRAIGATVASWGCAAIDAAVGISCPAMTLSAVTSNSLIVGTQLWSSGQYRFDLTLTSRDACGQSASSTVSHIVQLLPAATFELLQIGSDTPIADPCTTDSPCGIGGICRSTSTAQLVNGVQQVHTSISCECIQWPVRFYGLTCSFALVDCPHCISRFRGGSRLSLIGFGLDSMVSLQVSAYNLPFTNVRTVREVDDINVSNALQALRISPYSAMFAAINSMQILDFISPTLVAIGNRTLGAPTDSLAVLRSAGNSSAVSIPALGEDFLEPASSYELLVLGLRFPSAPTVETVEIRKLVYYSGSSCIQPGQFKPTSSGTCSPCPENAICPGGGRAFPRAGSYSYSEFSTPIRCEIAEACPGVASQLAGAATSYFDQTDDSNPAASTKCSPLYDGPMCKSCTADSYSLNGACFKCDSNEEAALVLLLIVLACVMAILAWGVARLEALKLAKFIGFFCTLQQVAVVGLEGSRTLPKYSQELSWFFTYMNLLNFDVDIFRLGCSVPYLTYPRKYIWTLVFMALTMIMFAVACTIRYWLRVRQVKREGLPSTALYEDDDGEELAPDVQPASPLKAALTHVRNDARRRLLHSFLILCCITYLRVLILSLRDFRCELAPVVSLVSTNGLLEPSPDSTSEFDSGLQLYLSEDLLTRCYSDEHLGITILVFVVLICHVLIFPLYVFTILSRAFGTEETGGMVGFLWRTIPFLRSQRKRKLKLGAARPSKLDVKAKYVEEDNPPLRMLSKGVSNLPSPSGAALATVAPDVSPRTNSSDVKAERVPPAGEAWVSVSKPSTDDKHEAASRLALELRQREAFGFLYLNQHPQHFTYCMQVLGLQVWFAFVTVFSDKGASERVFLLAFGSFLQTVGIAAVLPFASPSANTRKVLLGVATLAHALIMIAVQTNGAHSTFFIVLIILFACLIALFAVRNYLPPCKRKGEHVDEVELVQEAEKAKAEDEKSASEHDATDEVHSTSSKAPSRPHSSRANQVVPDGTSSDPIAQSQEAPSPPPADDFNQATGNAQLAIHEDDVPQQE